MPLPADRTAFLADWFARFGSSPVHEIEARIKDVSPSEWAGILARLQSNPAWASTAHTVRVDTNYSGGMRATVDRDGGGGGPRFLRKTQLERMDVFGGGVHPAQEWELSL